ncbi:ABC transporter ATP-binding protein, partial [Leucobacter sp. M11]|uniref:ABC transporter ATP-binding protein n=1 Tax=Leucobacter sp. M11 TaxID=2993565 RepID=UPI002D7FE01A
MTATPAIQLGDVSWTYRGVETPALHGLDMTIDRGETVVLAGASGSGKSTILRLMNGLIPHLHEGRLTGDVRLLGASTTALDLAGFGRKTGSVWQHPFRQFFASTVTDEIAFALENHGDVPERIRHRVDELLTSHDLVQVRNRLLSTLSSGQQQLVALLAAIAHRPQLLLLDEPSANLSESATARLVASLARLRGEGVTTVIAEHRISPFLPITDRIVSVSGGRLETTWRPQAFTRLSEHERSSHGLRPRTLPPQRAVPGVASGRSIEASGPQTSAHRADTPALRNAREGVTLENILCVKDGHVILDLDHAHFPPGRVTVLRGGNGAGKTTLARIIVGLQR